MKQFMTTALLLAAGAAAALAWPLSSTGDIAFTVDGAAFADLQGKTWQQLYWSFPASGFASAETLGQRLSRFRTVVQLKDSSGLTVMDEGWNTLAPMPGAAELKRKNLLRLDQIDARSLRPGLYQLSFVITDLISGKSGTLAAGLAVPAIRTDRPSLSQIELCTEIRPDSLEKRFRKGGLKVQPNPGHLYTESANIGYYYFEVYGLADPAGTRLRITYNSENDSVRGTVADDTLPGTEHQAVRVGGIRLDSLPEGGYQLWAQLLDGRGHPLAAASAAFTIKRNPLAAMPGGDLMQAQQDATEREGGPYYSRIEYIATGRQLETYRRLDSLGRREFLRQFWKSRDPNPKTPENEALIEHRRRYESVNDKYSESVINGQEGSVTDRGRFYIKYGEPEEIDPRPMEEDSKPAIIWRYASGKKVIFVDFNGNGRYQLVWTNFTGEHNYPKYYKVLSPFLMEAEDIPF